MRRIIFLLFIILLAGCKAKEDQKPAPVRVDNQLLSTEWKATSTIIKAENAAQLTLTGVLNGRGTVYETAFNNQHYATLSGDEHFSIWNLRNGQTDFNLWDKNIRLVKFLADGETFLTLNTQNDLAKRTLSDENPVQEIKVHDQPYTAWSVSPDENLIAVGTQDGFIHIFNTTTLEKVTQFIAHHGGFAVNALYFAPNGNILYSVGGEGSVRSWNTVTWEIISEANDEKRLLATAVTPNGSQLLTARSAQIAVYDTNTGNLVTTFEIPPFENIQAMKFSPDGQWLAMGGDVDNVVIFDIASGDLVVALPGHGSNFADLAFSANHDLIVTGISGGNAFLWDLRGLLGNSSQQVQIPKAVLQQVRGLQLHKVDWSPDGTKIMLIDRNGPIFVLGISS